MSPRVCSPAVRARDQQGQGLQRSSGITQARLGPIQAQALEIWAGNGRLECVVAATGKVKQAPTVHNLDHAYVTSLIMSQQAGFRGLECRFVVLRYADGTRQRVAVDLDRARMLLAKARRARTDPRHVELVIPAPLVGYLASDKVRQD
jgi:hypothetical protein